MATEGPDFTTTLNYDEMTTVSEEFVTTVSDYELTTSSNQEALSVDRQHAIFEVFNILEVAMTALELMIWIVAAIKMPRWRKNYRNQMLMQISASRFVKRLIFSLMYLQDHHQLTNSKTFSTVLNSSQIYIDFVIIILVFFFIKHMYDSLIIVVVKVRQNSLYKISMYAWLLPAPISGVWTVIIIYKAMDQWLVYLLICCIFRWPLIFMGTLVYITVLYRVLSDKIRRFARSLTVVTFLMCLMINFYLFSKDVIELWCMQDHFETKLVSYVSGMVMNFLILTFYIILITLEYKHSNNQSNQLKNFNSLPNYSIYEVNKI